MKKILSLLLCCAMATSLCVPAFAIGAEAGKADYDGSDQMEVAAEAAAMRTEDAAIDLN